MQQKLKVTHYDMNPGNCNLRIALVADLHDADGTQLLRLLEQEKPDLILAAGDIIERHDRNYAGWNEEKEKEMRSNMGKRTPVDSFMWTIECLFAPDKRQTTNIPTNNGMEFLQRARDIAPVYYSVGNHEWYLTQKDYQILSESGVVVLNNADCEAQISGRNMKIGGFPIRYDMDWLREFSKKDGCKFLICHNPEFYKNLIRSTDLDTFDLIVCGHYHGGHWRIFNRGVYVPRVGLMVKETVGKFDRMVITAGVASPTRLPRFRNPCELVILSPGADTASGR